MPTKKENLQHLFYRKSQTSNKKIASSAAPKLAITAQTSRREDLRKLGGHGTFGTDGNMSYGHYLWSNIINKMINNTIQAVPNRNIMSVPYAGGG